MTEHDIITAMARAMAEGDGIAPEALTDRLLFNGVDYRAIARRQYFGQVAYERCTRVLIPVTTPEHDAKAATEVAKKTGAKK